jgi:hypothetical protein
MPPPPCERHAVFGGREMRLYVASGARDRPPPRKVSRSAQAVRAAHDGAGRRTAAVEGAPRAGMRSFRGFLA